MTEEKKPQEEQAPQKDQEQEQEQPQKQTDEAQAPQENEASQEEEIEVPEELKGLVEQIENLTVAQLAKLVKVLEKKFGVSSAPVVGAMVAPAGQTGSAPEEQASKSSYNVVLTAIGDKKIEVIKAVKEITQKGLKEAKDLVDKVAEGPQIIMENVKAEEAEEMKKKLESAGASVELK